MKNAKDVLPAQYWPQIGPVFGHDDLNLDASNAEEEGVEADRAQHNVGGVSGEGWDNGNDGELSEDDDKEREPAKNCI
ncbi:hypothetical protein BDY19DRAFT_997008 [Irpex rosettiformis]|uniref:Uncharacterized protein n=1 Tax=Irpex rosettiformis TaxID=378272 RepID=A0ACB8TSU1_9APHY|nr:hypothetical protein BDY19DRAFT_997008 [Irpex rosettiformis]